MHHEPLLLSIESQSSSDNYSFADEVIKRGLNAIKLTLDRGYNFNNAKIIIQLAIDNKIDVIHSHGYKSNILLGSLPKHMRVKPCISTIHGWTAVRKFSKIWLYTILDKYFLRKMDAIVYVNPLMRNTIKHKNYFVIVNGIPDYNLDDERVHSSDHKTSNFCTNGFIIGCISRLSHEKGIKYLIEAVHKLSLSGIDVKLVIVGEGPLKESLQEYVLTNNLSDKIIFPGYRSNASDYLTLFDVFVLPSLTEGIPISILEAMQAGVPVIATRVGGVPSMLENGKYGVMIEPSDSDCLVDAITKIKNNYNLAIIAAKNAKIRVYEKYSSQRMAQEYLNVYEKVLERWKN